jgi:hypothetical protein
MDWTPLILKLNEIVPLVVMTAVVWLVSVIVRYANQHTESNRLKTATTLLGSLVTDATKEVLPLIAAEVKKAGEDGVIDAVEMAKISRVAIDGVKTVLGKRGLEFITKAIPVAELDGMIETMISGQVHDLIAKRAATTTTVAKIDALGEVTSATVQTPATPTG